MPHAIQGGHIPLTFQCDHSPRNEFGFPGVIKPPSIYMSLCSFEIFISMRITRGHPPWVLLNPLEYFLSISSSFMGFHQPLRNFSKYEVFLYKFLITSQKNILSMKSFISHLTLLRIFLSIDSLMVSLYILKKVFKHDAYPYTQALQFITRGFNPSSYLKEI